MGKVSRNCTEDGWSEPFPRYIDVCFFDDNITDPVRPRPPGRGFSSRCFQGDAGLTLCIPTSGRVLRLHYGPVHGRLQHLAGVPDHCHGHSVQIQVTVFALLPPPNSS